MKMRNAIFLTCLLLLTVPALGETVDRTVDVSPAPLVSIENLTGSVKITGWERSQVRVTGTLGEDVEELEIHHDDNEVHIEVEVDEDDMGRNKKIESHLEISVPWSADLEVETLTASIEVSEVGGELELASTSADITVTGAPSAVEAESVSGSITVSGQGTPVEAESVSGNVTVRGGGEMIDASTVSGDIHVEAAAVREASFESVSGSLMFSGNLAERAELDAEVHSGKVILVLPADVSATFEIETFSGDIQNQFGAEPTRTSGFMPSKSLEFDTGTGSAAVSIETFSGSVELKKQ
jgi:DUF4097 and DUF4098 domain-containing protein YvlB